MFHLRFFVIFEIPCNNKNTEHLRVVFHWQHVLQNWSCRKGWPDSGFSCIHTVLNSRTGLEHNRTMVFIGGPLRVPILPFWHTTFSKHNRLGRQHPLRCPRPLWEILDLPLVLTYPFSCTVDSWAECSLEYNRIMVLCTTVSKVEWCHVAIIISEQSCSADTFCGVLSEHIS